jgi:3-hydroxybutyryl-CoA dehydratase
MIAQLAFSEYKVGMEARFERCLNATAVDEFARLSGDHNPLHTDAEFARRAGFRDRVVHGAFLVAMVSRLVGMELPGEQSLLLSLKLDFAAPSFPDERIEVVGTIESLHPEQQVMALRIRITCDGETRARGSALVRVNA